MNNANDLPEDITYLRCPECGNAITQFVGNMAAFDYKCTRCEKHRLSEFITDAEYQERLRDPVIIRVECAKKAASTLLDFAKALSLEGRYVSEREVREIQRHISRFSQEDPFDVNWEGK